MDRIEILVEQVRNLQEQMNVKNTLFEMLEKDGQKLDVLRHNLVDARNELCVKCKNYLDAHNGACDGCRWSDDSDWLV